MTTEYATLFDQVADLMEYTPLADLEFAQRADLEEAVRSAATATDLAQPFAGWLNEAMKTKTALDAMTAVTAEGSSMEGIKAQLMDLVRHRIVKGGPGSGYHKEDGHTGRPGQRGGSSSDGNNGDQADDRAKRVEVVGDIDHLKDFGLTQEDITDLADLDLADVTATVEIEVRGRFDRYLGIKGEWFDKSGKNIGSFERTLDKTGLVATLSSLSFKGDYMAKGLGTKVARKWYQKLADAGYEKAELFANSTIGKYAWAKEGAQYASVYKADEITSKFAEWAKSYGVSGDWSKRKRPVFKTPQDVANYKHPDGVTFSGKHINNDAVPDDVRVHMGKAFMLDMNGHESWDATINLKDWKGKAQKAAALAGYKKGADDLCYVETSKETTDGSDALFWSQYLSEDEGEPIFGFGESSLKSGGRIIKGGAGSGNRGRIGRPKARGGSAPRGFDHRLSNERIDQLKRRNPSATPVVMRMSQKQKDDYAALYANAKKRDSQGWARIQAIEEESKFAPLILGGTSDLWWVEDGAYRLAVLANRGQFNFFAYFNDLPGPTKGGPGSGYHREDGHEGRPGQRGGSASDGNNGDRGGSASDGKPNDRGGEPVDLPRHMEFFDGRVIIDGDLNLLRDHGITPEQLAKISYMGGDTKTFIAVYEDGWDGDNYLKIVGSMQEGRKDIGRFERHLYEGGKVAHLEELVFEKEYLDQGFGMKVAHGWYEALADAGYKRAELYADLTIGKYAWAKEGAEYSSERTAAEKTKDFAAWVKRMKIPDLEDGRDLPVFTKVLDVATYKHPAGHKVKGSAIKNEAVDPNAEFDLGKAYMLDTDGHGSWNATINLEGWKSKHKQIKAVTVDDLIGVTVDDLVGATAANLCYVDVGRDFPGGSDASFWSQYLDADEGEPVFGFSETTLKSGGRIVKGGAGSGYFRADGHAGRKGERGGSSSDGNNGGAGGEVTGGVGAEVSSGVDFNDSTQVHSSVSSYVQGSPALSKVAGSSAPLPAEYMTTPAGAQRGAQYLPQMLKDLGIDQNLPGQATLTHGAKSLYMELTDDEELNRLLSKVPPDPAHSTGFWVPGKAASGGAHGKLKEGAKEADGKKLEKARKKEENRVKPIMMSALIEAGLTGDYSGANALQLHYQLVGNLATFGLMLGYSTINMGMQVGTVVLDRGDLIVDPELVVREAVGAGTGRRRRGGRVIKGGEGSGNHGHKGRKGQRGGSADDGKPNSGGVGNGGTNRFSQDRVTLEGDLELLEDYGFQPEDIAEISYLDDDTHALVNVTLNADPDLVEQYGDDYLTISGIFINPDTGREVGSFERHLMASSNKAHLQVLAFDNDYLNRGFGSKVARDWYSALADAGYTQADFLADLTIGKYAWAKEGAQYANPQNAVKDINERFGAWCKQKKIPGLLERRNRPIFKTPQDVANYKHPRVYKVKGRDIVNEDVDKNAEFHVGKAFMLDENGHGQWEAVIDLRGWKGKKGKALKAADLAGGDAKKDERCYVQVGRDFPGGSDAAFWSQYLSEDEGEPIFGFDKKAAPTNALLLAMTDSGKSTGGRIIKGGAGSGNHGHAGRAGQRGGSADDGKPNESDKKPVQRMVFAKGAIVMYGDIDKLEEFGFTPGRMARICKIGTGEKTVIQVSLTEDGDLSVSGVWKAAPEDDSGNGIFSQIGDGMLDEMDGDFDSDENHIGNFSRLLKKDKKTAVLDVLDIGEFNAGKGMGTAIARKWYQELGRAGYEKASFLADLTIGRYAWAKEGAEFANPADAKKVTARFKAWLAKKGSPNNTMYDVRTPSDIAFYVDPRGKTLTNKDIRNEAVRSGTKMNLGKAFMLDTSEDGMGEWDGIIKLKFWINRDLTQKAAPVAFGKSGKTRIGLIDSSHPIEGGSDELFWAQYTGEDEGEPMFGFKPFEEGAAGPGVDLVAGMTGQGSIKE